MYVIYQVSLVLQCTSTKIHMKKYKSFECYRNLPLVFCEYTDSLNQTFEILRKIYLRGNSNKFVFLTILDSRVKICKDTKITYNMISHYKSHNISWEDSISVLHNTQFFITFLFLINYSGVSCYFTVFVSKNGNFYLPTPKTRCLLNK